MDIVIKLLFCMIIFTEINAVKKNDKISRYRDIEISKRIIQKLNRIKSFAQFIEEFDIEPPKRSFESMMMASNYPESRESYMLGGLNAANDSPSCQLMQKFEEIPKSKTDSFIFFPSCIKVNRCSGCCNTDIMECVALTNSSLFIDVYKVPTNGNRPYLYRVSYFNDESCGCQCKIKKENCSPKQIYDEGNCECLCNSKPKACSSKQQWSDITCDCTCKEVKSCSGGNFWNDITCQCEKKIKTKK
ncbi:vascular endothelial growth factor A isoform X5 [Hydra vulgaris]|uniref:Vascular endothelial growth factor A isoform X5 n=1 Tax=Hydra vulgaris TaxID=6087 RepID=A0ABM4D7H8_HYDVU